MRIDRRMSPGTVSFEDVNCTKETPKAILCVIGEKKHWIPKSIVHDDSFVYGQGHTGRLVLPTWWAEKEGLA